VGTILSFRVGAEDAEFLEKEFMPDFLANDFVNLPKYNFYVKLMIDGISSRPFSANNIEPYQRPAQSFKDVIIENSRRQYATPREIVEEKIASEWTMQGEKVFEQKILSRGERPLHQVLTKQIEPPQAPRAPRIAGEKKKVDLEDLRAALEKSLGDQDSN
jgi:hypothetical protein